MLPVVVSVATQTDGGVDSTFFTLSVSSESSVSLSMSTLDLSSDESNEVFASRRVISSQTDLTLSDFDFGVCQESDDFDDDFDEGLDNSFNPYELLSFEPIEESWYSNVGSASDSSSPASSTESGIQPGRRPTGEPDAEDQCQQFFDLLRNQCNVQSGQKRVKPEDTKGQKEKLVTESTDVNCESVGSQKGGRIPTRMVPKMGTKVEFSRPLTSPSTVRFPGHPTWQPLPLKLEMPRCPLPPSVTQNRLSDLRGRYPDYNSNRGNQRFIETPDHNSNPKPVPDHISNPKPVTDHNSNPFDPMRSLSNGNAFVLPPGVGFYHSDSERPNLLASSILSPRNFREWNSDGDARIFSFPSSDDSTDQSPEPKREEDGGEEQKTDSLRRLYEQYADVMYTNEANLQHTIMVQQRLFEQQIANRYIADDKRTSAKSTQPLRSIPWAASAAAHSTEQPASLEWVIKRRADGTRYITRRPIAAKGRERVKQQPPGDDRRCVVMTTTEGVSPSSPPGRAGAPDDEAGSGPKPGRYWTKEERRQHVEKVRDQKRMKDAVVKPAIGVALETSNSVHPGEMKRSKVRKEHVRIRSQEQTVNFQELLAHGKVEAQGKPSENPLLSVITI